MRFFYLTLYDFSMCCGFMSNVCVRGTASVSLYKMLRGIPWLLINLLNRKVADTTVNYISH